MGVFFVINSGFGSSFLRGLRSLASKSNSLDEPLAEMALPIWRSCFRWLSKEAIALALDFGILGCPESYRGKRFGYGLRTPGKGRGFFPEVGG